MSRDRKGSDGVQSENGMMQEIPVLAELSPRALLTANQGTRVERSIACRRVVTLLGSKRGCKVVLPHKHVAPEDVFPKGIMTSVVV